MKQIQFIILTCDQYLNTRVETIRKTWGMNKNIKFLTDSEIYSEDLIGFGTQKNYLGIFDKYYNIFKSYDWNQYDYYFFTDDDTFVIHRNLDFLYLPPKEELFCMCRELCLNPNGTDMYGQHTGTDVSLFKGENINLPLHYPSGGSGFILSQYSCKEIQSYLNTSQNVPRARFGDLTIGFWIRNCKIKIIHNKNFWWTTHDKLVNNPWDPYHNDENVITFHYVDENLMEEYNKKYNSNDKI